MPARMSASLQLFASTRGTRSASRNGVLIVVTNEVGFGVHPPSELGRWFQDGLGRVNQMLAEAADQVVLMIAGVPMTIKSAARPT